ncbi:MAG: tripartite tricarboxylate transporter substrate binding protein, partial [Burkholderiales bacterium]|nr:tripartite tricarboxylate transporter substrate binding protein [Burkholderiales bacterium]
AKTPAPIVARMQAEIAKVVRLQEIKDKMLLQGAAAVSSTGPELERIVKDELVKWAAVAKAAKIKVD